MSKLALIFILFPCLSFASGTAVGNGGEPILHFLEATRFALVQSLRMVHDDPASARSLCASTAGLTSPQKSFCHDYLLSILDQIVSMNVDPNKVDFVLRDETLLVIGPDGKPMPVSARTDLGPKGAIEFSLDAIKLMAPKTLLQLLAHEMQHKTIYAAKSPTDNDPIGPFANGRLLIDSAADALTSVALANGYIGKEFVLRDSFECLVSSGGSPIGMRLSTSRWFFDDSLTNYQLSLSKRPSDPQVSVIESIHSKIVFQLEVVDPKHCDSSVSAQSRYSRVSLWRVDDDPAKAPVRLSDQILSDENPLCDKSQRSFSASYGSNSFTCRYYGSSAL